MTIEQLRSLQEALLHHIFLSDVGNEQFRQVENTIPFDIFGTYRKLAEFARGKSYDDIQIQRVSTELVKLWLSGQMADIIATSFSYPNFFDDIKILTKEWLMGRGGDNFNNLVEFQRIAREIDEKCTIYQSKSYMIRELYDDMITELSERSERKRKGLLLGYSTGFPILDRYTEGIQKGTLMRLNAYSNVGKSRFSYQVVNHLIKQSAHVIYFSLEVRKNQLIYNLIANYYRKPMGSVYRMEFDDMDFGELFASKLEIVDDKYQLDEILAYATMRKPDVIVVDFVQNIRVSGGGSEYERMTEVAIKLQQFAIKNNIAVFDISQISNEGARVDSDVIPSKGSGALVASADVGLLMKRDKIDEEVIIVKIAKNKFGWRKELEYRIDYESGVFTEIGETLKEPKSTPKSF